jgi:hypothetical protein
LKHLFKIQLVFIIFEFPCLGTKIYIGPFTLPIVKFFQLYLHLQHVINVKIIKTHLLYVKILGHVSINGLRTFTKKIVLNFALRLLKTRVPSPCCHFYFFCYRCGKSWSLSLLCLWFRWTMPSPPLWSCFVTHEKIIIMFIMFIVVMFKVFLFCLGYCSLFCVGSFCHGYDGIIIVYNVVLCSWSSSMSCLWSSLPCFRWRWKHN